MQIVDVMPLEQWIDFERDLNARTGLNSCVYDADGFRITHFVKWANPICPLVKANPAGLQAICSIAHQNLAAQARQGQRPVVGECDAGFVKICAPVYVRDQFLGSLGGCGLFLEDGELESFLVARLTGQEEEHLHAMAQDIPRMSTKQADAVARHLQDKIEEFGASCTSG